MFGVGLIVTLFSVTKKLWSGGGGGFGTWTPSTPPHYPFQLSATRLSLLFLNFLIKLICIAEHGQNSTLLITVIFRIGFKATKPLMKAKPSFQYDFQCLWITFSNSRSLPFILYQISFHVVTKKLSIIKCKHHLSKKPIFIYVFIHIFPVYMLCTSI